MQSKPVQRERRRTRVLAQKRKILLTVVTVVRNFKTIDPTPISLEAANEVEKDILALLG